MPDETELVCHHFCLGRTQATVENWRQEYNNYRPHSSLDYLIPADFARRYYENKQAGEATQPVEMVGTLSV